MTTLILVLRSVVVVLVAYVLVCVAIIGRAVRRRQK